MKDPFGREITYLRLSVTELCNLRCRYCMGAEGIVKKEHAQMLTEEEMIAAVEAAASLGVRKLRITGGEPLVKRNILSICRRAAAVDGIEEVCLTTNGTLLPALAVPLREAGVSRVNVSLDTLSPERYRNITRVGELDQALAGLEAACAAGFRKIKVNTVLLGGVNDDEIRALAALTQERPIDVRFIELMPMAGGDLGAEAYITGDRVLEALPELTAEPEDGGVARLYRLPGAQGNIGVISPLSRHFCAACNRIRITADGHVKPCLHTAEEYTLKGLDRDGMARVLREAIAHKPDRHMPLSASQPSAAARGMNRIGG